MTRPRLSGLYFKYSTVPESAFFFNFSSILKQSRALIPHQPPAAVWSAWHACKMSSSSRSKPLRIPSALLFDTLLRLLHAHLFSINHHSIHHSMRFPSFSTILRTLYTISNSTRPIPASQRALAPFTRGTILKSMPTIPFLSSFFSTAPSRNMSHAVTKSDDEWQAVLNPGTSPPLPIPHPIN